MANQQKFLKKLKILTFQKNKLYINKNKKHVLKLGINKCY